MALNERGRTACSHHISVNQSDQQGAVWCRNKAAQQTITVLLTLGLLDSRKPVLINFTVAKRFQQNHGANDAVFKVE